MKFPDPANLPTLAALAKKDNERLLTGLKKLPQNRLDEWFHTLHEEAFSEYDCLHCANCCKSISPMVTHNDVNRLAEYQRLKPSDIVTKHLDTEPDGTFVFHTLPCPYLDSENYCLVYRNRPKACTGYPHTDRRRMNQLLQISLKNTFICPVVYAIFMEMRKALS